MRLDDKIADMVREALMDESMTETLNQYGVTANFVANYVSENFFDELLGEFVMFAADVKEFHCPRCDDYNNLPGMAYVFIRENRDDASGHGICKNCFQKTIQRGVQEYV